MNDMSSDRFWLLDTPGPVSERTVRIRCARWVDAGPNDRIKITNTEGKTILKADGTQVGQYVRLFQVVKGLKVDELTAGQLHVHVCCFPED